MESQPGRYEFFPHTADAKFRAYGRTREELFRNAALATFAVITNPEAVQARRRFPIRVESKRLEAALFDFLDELLFLLDTEGFLLHDCEELNIEEKNGSIIVTCDAVGDDHYGYDVSCNVKAVTYNEMYVKKEGGRWECQVVLDL